MDTKIFELLRARLEQSVKQKRYEHSLRVTQTARMLCKKFGRDEEKAALAGIAHDMCKEYSPDMLLELAARDGCDIMPLEKSRPSLLHGRTAAVVLKDEYGIDDDEILEAVRAHTFGKPNMCGIAKIIYIADKIEPGRKHVNEEYLLRLDAFTLDELLFYVVDGNIGYLEQKGEKVSSFSYALRETLKGIM